MDEPSSTTSQEPLPLTPDGNEEREALLQKVKWFMGMMLQSFTKPAGDSVKLVCRHSLSDSALSILSNSSLSWKFNGMPLVMDPSRDVYYKGNVELTDLSPADCGVYTCDVKYAEEGAVNNLTIGVYSLQVTTETPTNIVFAEEPFALDCHSHSLGRIFPSSTRHWMYNGTYVKVPGVTLAYNTSADVIQKITKSVEGIWECHVMHSSTDRVWKTAWYSLSVEAAPSRIARWYRTMTQHLGVVITLFVILVVVITIAFIYSAFSEKKISDQANESFRNVKDGWEKILHGQMGNSKVDADAVESLPATKDGTDTDSEADDDSGGNRRGSQDTSKRKASGSGDPTDLEETPLGDEMGYNDERVQSYERGINDERGQSYERGINEERGQIYERGINDEWGQSYERGINDESGQSDERGQSGERGQSDERGYNDEMGYNDEKDNEGEPFPGILDTGITFEDEERLSDEELSRIYEGMKGRGTAFGTQEDDDPDDANVSASLNPRPSSLIKGNGKRISKSKTNASTHAFRNASASNYQRRVGGTVGSLQNMLGIRVPPNARKAPTARVDIPRVTPADAMRWLCKHSSAPFPRGDLSSISAFPSAYKEHVLVRGVSSGTTPAVDAMRRLSRHSPVRHTRDVYVRVNCDSQYAQRQNPHRLDSLKHHRNQLESRQRDNLKHHRNQQESRQRDNLKHHRNQKESRQRDNLKHHRNQQESRQRDNLKHHRNQHESRQRDNLKYHRNQKESRQRDNLKHHRNQKESRQRDNLKHHRNQQESRQRDNLKHHRNQQESRQRDNLKHHRNQQESRQRDNLKYHRNQLESRQRCNLKYHRSSYQLESKQKFRKSRCSRRWPDTSLVTNRVQERLMSPTRPSPLIRYHNVNKNNDNDGDHVGRTTTGPLIESRPSHGALTSPETKEYISMETIPARSTSSYLKGRCRRKLHFTSSPEVPTHQMAGYYYQSLNKTSSRLNPDVLPLSRPRPKPDVQSSPSSTSTSDMDIMSGPFVDAANLDLVSNKPVLWRVMDDFKTWWQQRFRHQGEWTEKNGRRYQRVFQTDAV